MRLTLSPLTLTLREPLITSFATITTRDLLVVALHDSDGRVGVAEAAPFEPYDGVSLAEVQAQLRGLESALADCDGASLETLVELARSHCDLPQARSAIDTAAWDLEGQRTGRSVFDLLGATGSGKVSLNATIGAGDPAAAAQAATAAVRDGFSCLKVKVGDGGDLERLQAVRSAVGPEVAIRIDANGAWNVDQAIAALELLAPLDIELCEEPVHGLQQLRQVREGSPAIPIAMDETAATAGALGSGATDLVCLKLTRCGGISGLIDAAAEVRASGAQIYLASTLDGPAGIAASLQVAAALGPLVPCGLATLALFEQGEAPAPLVDGAIVISTGPGLGLSGPTAQS